jgi:hypothetical protein
MELVIPVILMFSLFRLKIYLNLKLARNYQLKIEFLEKGP